MQRTRSKSCDRAAPGCEIEQEQRVHARPRRWRESVRSDARPDAPGDPGSPRREPSRALRTCITSRVTDVDGGARTRIHGALAAHSGNASSTLPALPVQYADFAQWQRRQLSGDSLQRMLAYWTQQLAGLPVVHSFPLDKKRPEKQSVAGALVSQSLDKHLGDSLIALGRRQDCTLFMLMQAAFSVLLGRYSGESDIVIGTPVANRPGAELAPMIAFS